MLVIIFMYAIFATSFPITKILLSYSDPFFFTGIRMIIGGSILITYYTAWLKNKWTIPRDHYGIYVQMIILGFYANYIARFWSINHLSSTKSCIIFTLYPLVSSILSYFFFSERISRKQSLGYVFGICSVAPILITASPASESLLRELWTYSWPEAAMLVSVVADCYKWILMRKLVLDTSSCPFMINGLCMTAGGILALITSVPIEGIFPISSVWPFIGYLGIYIFISNIISSNLYSFLLRSYTVTFLSFAGFMAPLFASLYGWLCLNEQISRYFCISAIMLIIGLYLFFQDELRYKKTQ